MTRARAVIAAVPRRAWTAVASLVVVASVALAAVFGAGLSVWRGGVGANVPPAAPFAKAPGSGLVVVPGPAGPATHRPAHPTSTVPVTARPAAATPATHRPATRGVTAHVTTNESGFTVVPPAAVRPPVPGLLTLLSTVPPDVLRVLVTVQRVETRAGQVTLRVARIVGYRNVAGRHGQSRLLFHGAALRRHGHVQVTTLRLTLVRGVTHHLVAAVVPHATVRPAAHHAMKRHQERVMSDGWLSWAEARD